MLMGPPRTFDFKAQVLNCCTLLPPTAAPAESAPRPALWTLFLGLHSKQQPGGVFGVVLAVDQHQGLSLMVLDHRADAAETLRWTKTNPHIS